MIFRPSQRLCNKIKAGPLSPAPLHENPYADWSARLLTVDRCQYLLASHTTSFYSFVLFGRGIPDSSRFIQQALASMREFMEDDGLSLIYANFITPATGSVRFCKPLNRSSIGSMNELEAQAKAYLEDEAYSPFEVGEKLNQMPLSALDYAMPREAFKRMSG